MAVDWRINPFNSGNYGCFAVYPIKNACPANFACQSPEKGNRIRRQEGFNGGKPCLRPVANDSDYACNDCLFFLRFPGWPLSVLEYIYNSWHHSAIYDRGPGCLW